MNKKNPLSCAHIASVAAALTLLLTSPADSAEEQGIEWQSPWRLEVAIGLHSWSGLGDIAAADGASFDSTGFNLSGAAHYSIRKFEDSELLIGGDLGFMSAESNIDLYIEDLTARAMYVGPSMKWVFGLEHSYSLDVGIMYWDIDFAEVSTDYLFYLERVVWKDDAAGAYVGATWDPGSDDPHRTSGVSLSFKAHFVEFGDVNADETLFRRALGTSPGKLNGPIYQMQIGYRWR